jgi:aminopeptidase I
MTKNHPNHPNLRKTVSTTDLYADPSPPPRHASLSRAFTTAHRPRRHVNPFLQARGDTQRLRHQQLPLDDQDSPQVQGTLWDQYCNANPLQRYSATSLHESHRHSIAAPQASDLIDLEDGYEYSGPQEQQSPPPVPPKIPEAPVSEPKVEAVRSKEGPEKYTKPFTDFMTANPTVFHAVDAVAQDLEKGGYKKLSERDGWELKQGGKYYVERNGSSLIAFSIGDGYEAGNGAAIVAGHIDALTARLKPIPTLRTKAGYVQLGVAPYAGGLNETWWDRDLGVGGRVLVKEHGKIVTKLVKLDWPIARIPTLAPHFGAAAVGPFNKETQMVPIVGLDNSDLGSFSTAESEWKTTVLGGEGTFAATQPERLVKAISDELSITDCRSTKCALDHQGHH